MHNEEISSTPKHKSWRTSSSLALSLMVVSFITWILILILTAGELEIKPTEMIVKGEGCDYLRENGITTKNAEGENHCTINVPFRSNSFGNGGVIILKDRQIRIPNEQVVLVGSIENAPWTPSQIQSAILISVSTIFMFAMMGWSFIINFSSKS